ncbi:MAG: putative Integral rane sensor signal transduction histidine kinase, partial [Pedosphaera sp.]|nr:putative Integral rane sensor signal transduction histidine kinase [Pedosphaera sp.]
MGTSSLVALTLSLMTVWLSSATSALDSTNVISSAIVIQEVIVDGQPEPVSQRMLSFSKAATSALASTNVVSSAIVIQEVIVDGQPQPVSHKMLSFSKTASEADSSQANGTDRLRISSSAQRMEFRFGPNPTSLNPPLRLRYQLAGFDKEWREAGGEMRLNVRFLDASSNTVNAQDFTVKGESVGWGGAVFQSRFDRRREEVQVPERAIKMQLELFSGGSEQTVGMMVIDDLTV